MVYASLEKGIAKFRSAKTGPKSHLLADLLRPSSDYFLSHTQAPDAALRAIHMVTPHQTAKWRAHHIQQPHSPPSCYISACPASHGGSSSPTQTPCSGSLTKHGRRVATATAIGRRDCHHTEATAAPAQTHRSCSAPPLSNAGVERQTSQCWS